MQKIRSQKEKFQQELKENTREIEYHHDDSLSDEVYILKQKLAKLQKTKKFS